MDNHFNPTVSDQCVARTHRYGQTKQVRCFRLAIEGTVEEKIYKRSENKSAVASRVLDGVDSELHFSAYELNDLQRNDIIVRCTKCDKKRLLPEGLVLLGIDDDDSWECKNNLDPKHNHCDIPEEDKLRPQTRDQEEQRATEKDPILRHLLGVINKVTRKTPIVTRCFPVEVNRTDKSCDETIEKLTKELEAK